MTQTKSLIKELSKYTKVYSMGNGIAAYNKTKTIMTNNHSDGTIFNIRVFRHSDKDDAKVDYSAGNYYKIIKIAIKDFLEE